MQNKITKTDKFTRVKKSLGLKIHNFARAKKALGQNFLKSTLALNKITEAGEIKREDIVLEIGPGKGALTEKLLEKAGCVIAVEKDKTLVEMLKEKFEKQIKIGTLVLVHGDILEFKIINYFVDNSFFQVFERRQDVVLESLGRSGDDGQRKFSAENFRALQNNTLFPLSYKIIANIPYNITGAILKKFLTENNQPALMVLMVQNEVAKRIVARDKKESILSISIKAYGTPEMIMKVPARYFSPAPKVDSAVIKIKDISRKFFEENKINEEKFWKIVHLGFAHKRKKLAGNLKSVNFDPKISRINLDMELLNKRAEDLTLLDWIILTKASI